MEHCPLFRGNDPREINLSGWTNFSGDVRNPNDGEAKGSFNVVDSASTENTKIEFGVDKASAIDIEYNDKIRAYSEKTSIMTALEELTQVTESNLVYIYVKDYFKVFNYILGKPIEKTNEKNPNLNMDNVLNLLKSIPEGITYDFNEAYKLDVTIDFSKLNTALFGSDISNLGIISLQINFAPTDTSTLLTATLKDFTYSNCVGDLNISIMDPKTFTTPSDFGFNNSVGKVYLEDLPILMKVGLETTNKKAYKMSGNLKAQTTGVVSWFMSVDINATVNIYIRVGDTIGADNLYSVDGLIQIDCDTPTKGGGLQYTKTYTHLCTQFLINDKNAYIHQIETSYASYKKYTFPSFWWTDYEVTSYKYDYFKVTQQAMLQDILYYLLAYSLGASDLYDQVMDFIGKGMTLNIFTMFQYFKLAEAGKFQAKLNVISGMDVYADIHYDTASYMLSRIHAYSTFNIVIGKVTFDFDVNNQYISSVNDIKAEMDYYDSFLTNWKNNAISSNLDFRSSKDLVDSNYYYTSSSKLW